MEKSILESYQERLEAIQATLDENKIVLDAGIGTTLSYELIYDQFNKALEEAQAKLTELQQPIDMSDIGSANVIDRRSSNVRSEYSDDREGYLISEYDKRRLDGYEGPKYVEILEEIKQIRENKRADEIASLKDDIQEAQKLKAQVKAVEEAQKAKTELEAELKSEQARIQTEIDGVDTQKASIYKKIDEIKASIDATQTAIGLKSLPASAFRATVQAKQDCIAKKAKLEAKIESLNQQIDELKGDYFDINELLAQLNGKEEQELSNEPQAEPAVQGEEQAEKVQPDLTDDAEEIAKQEDEMWKELRHHDEFRKGTDEYLWEHNERPKKLEEEAREGQEIEEATQKEIEEYGDTGITPKPEEGLPLGPFRVPVKENAEPQKAQQQPTQSIKPENSAPVKPQSPKPATKKVTYKIKQAGLEVSESGMPNYYVILIDSKGNELKQYNEPQNGYYRIIKPRMEQNEILAMLQDKMISQPKKYYDFGLANLLQEVDSKFGTSGMNDYIKMLQDKDLLNDTQYYPFDIEYNLTNLTQMPTDKEDRDKMKYIKAIASANEKVGIATYAKAPTIFTKISNFVKEMWQKVTTKRLPNVNQTTKKATPEEIVEMYKKTWQDKDFDVEQFIKDCQMTPEEADTFRKVHQNRVKNEQYRKNVVTQVKDEQEPQISEQTSKTEEKEGGFAGQVDFSQEEIDAICMPFRRHYSEEVDGRAYTLSDLEKDMEKEGTSEIEKQVVLKDYKQYLNEKELLAKGKKFTEKQRKFRNGIQFFGTKGQKDMPNGTHVTGPKGVEDKQEKTITTEIMRRFQMQSKVSNFDLVKFAQENGLNQNQTDELQAKLNKRAEIAKNQEIYNKLLADRKKRDEGKEPGDE